MCTDSPHTLLSGVIVWIANQHSFLFSSENDMQILLKLWGDNSKELITDSKKKEKEYRMPFSPPVSITNEIIAPKLPHFRLLKKWHCDQRGTYSQL